MDSPAQGTGVQYGSQLQRQAPGQIYLTIADDVMAADIPLFPIFWLLAAHPWLCWAIGGTTREMYCNVGGPGPKPRRWGLCSEGIPGGSPPL